MCALEPSDSRTGGKIEMEKSRTMHQPMTFSLSNSMRGVLHHKNGNRNCEEIT